jgi:hypothetical protein
MYKFTIYLQQSHRKQNELLQVEGSVRLYGVHEAETINKDRSVPGAPRNGISWVKPMRRLEDFEVMGSGDVSWNGVY